MYIRTKIMAKRPSKSRNEAEDKFIDSLTDPKNLSSIAGKVKTGVQSEQFRVICGVVLGLFTLYLAIAFISFFFTGDADFSILEMSRAERAANRLEIQNWMGLPGAALVFLMVHEGFGLASAVLIALLGMCANKLLRPAQTGLLKFTICAAFWVLYGAALLGYVDYLLGEKLFFRLGGAFGAVVTTWAVSYVKVIGLLFILIALGLIFFICVDKTFIPKMRKVWQWLKGLFHSKSAESTELTEGGEDLGAEGTEKTEIELVIAGKEDEEEEKTDEGSGLTLEIVGQEPTETIEEVTTDEQGEDQPAEDEAEPTQDEGDENPDLEIANVKEVELAED